MAEVGTTGRQNPFKALAGDHIGIFSVSQIIKTGRIIPLASGRQNNRTDLERGFTFNVIIFYGLGNTQVFAQAAADTGFRIYGVGQGNRLGILNVGGPSVIKTLVNFIHGRHRTMPGAFSTPGTLGRIHVTWMIDKGNFKVSGFSLNTFDLTVSY